MIYWSSLLCWTLVRPWRPTLPSSSSAVSSQQCPLRKPFTTILYTTWDFNVTAPTPFCLPLFSKFIIVWFIASQYVQTRPQKSQPKSKFSMKIYIIFFLLQNLPLREGLICFSCGLLTSQIQTSKLIVDDCADVAPTVCAQIRTLQGLAQKFSENWEIQHPPLPSDLVRRANGHCWGTVLIIICCNFC